ncbi:DUF4350 domain-containing protein [Metabacillus sp. BG109]|uniref:DUF4350 domain-containing protein n=2 Tax=Metabacillus bambusae TaxID=2795218 RepID=A0ABS3N4I4_9BACI|nr:DUF4350 domain-containing protein [Metabacillus bambusae]
MLSSYYIVTGEPKNYPQYDTQSPSPTGIKAFYTYVENEMDLVNRWSHPPNLLPKADESQLLVMIEPAIIPNSEEMEAYEQFMEAGNTILLLKVNPKGMFDQRIIFTEDGVTSLHNITDQNEHIYNAVIESPVILEADEHDDILLQSENKGTIALKRAYGDGQLIVANSPKWITNGNILKDDHLPLLLTLFNEVNSQTVLFDEYLHGKQDASSILNVYPRWFILFLFQGIILTCLFLWYQGKRFGPLLVPREETVRYSDERIKALAAWYMRGYHYKDSLHIQADYVKLLLQERWGIPYSKEWEDIDIYLEKRLNKIPELEVNSFVVELTKVLMKEKVTKQDYLVWSKKLDQLRKEVEDNEHTIGIPTREL